MYNIYIYTLIILQNYTILSHVISRFPKSCIKPTGQIRESSSANPASQASQLILVDFEDPNPTLEPILGRFSYVKIK